MFGCIRMCAGLTWALPQSEPCRQALSLLEGSLTGHQFCSCSQHRVCVIGQAERERHQHCAVRIPASLAGCSGPSASIECLAGTWEPALQICQAAVAARSLHTQILSASQRQFQSHSVGTPTGKARRIGCHHPSGVPLQTLRNSLLVSGRSRRLRVSCSVPAGAVPKAPGAFGGSRPPNLWTREERPFSLPKSYSTYSIR